MGQLNIFLFNVRIFMLDFVFYIKVFLLELFWWVFVVKAILFIVDSLAIKPCFYPLGAICILPGCDKQKMTPGVATCPFRGWGESPILPQPQLISALYLFLKPQLSYSRPESSTSRFVGHLLRSSLSVLHAPRVTSHLLRLGWADSPDMVLPVLKSESLGKTRVSWSPWMHLLSPALVQ